jgi:NAD(P)H-hydrate repair Nnr-like enzyme with NAD(P)H-hydrate dehydratase domain
VTCHGLRHTANDLLRRVADGEVVRAILGHSTVAMTHHYSHVDEGEKLIAASRVFEVVMGGKTSTETKPKEVIKEVIQGSEEPKAVPEASQVC